MAGQVTGVLNKKVSFNSVSQVLYLFCLINYLLYLVRVVVLREENFKGLYRLGFQNVAVGRINGVDA